MASLNFELTGLSFDTAGAISKRKDEKHSLKSSTE
jgi:hypothetical protein